MSKQTKRNKFSKKSRKIVKRRGGMDPPGRGSRRRHTGRYSLNDFEEESPIEESHAMDVSDDPENVIIIPLYGEDPLQIRHQYPGLVRLTRPIGDVYGPNKRQRNLKTSRSMRRNSGR